MNAAIATWKTGQQLPRRPILGKEKRLWVQVQHVF